MLFEELAFRAEMIDEEQAQKVKDNLYLGAWIGWQMGAAGKSSFGDYYKNLGLSDEMPLDDETRKLMAEKAKEKAARIVAMAKKKKAKNNGSTL